MSAPRDRDARPLALLAVPLLAPFLLAACAETASDPVVGGDVAGSIDDPYHRLALEIEASADEVIAVTEGLRSDMAGLSRTGPDRLRDPFARFAEHHPDVVICDFDGDGAPARAAGAADAPPERDAVHATADADQR